ncbi:hypothetical protein BH23ACT12_BH23ACT12_11020 [soil metagenome]
MPRVACPTHGVRQILIPWTLPGSGFSLLFEALVMELVAEMPVKAVAELVGCDDESFGGCCITTSTRPGTRGPLALSRSTNSEM